MSKAISFVKLDLITVKPYLTLKNLFIFIAVAVFVTGSTGTSVMAISMIMVFAALYVSYPFSVGEKNGIDGLYSTLSIKRSTVVAGRYLFSVLIDICGGLIAYIFTFIIQSVMQNGFDAVESLLIVIAMFVVYSLVQAVQLPIYFKLGYAKAKFWAYLPFVGWPLAVLILSNLMKNNDLVSSLAGFFGWFENNPALAVIACAFVGLATMFISYRISLMSYMKRDF